MNNIDNELAFGEYVSIPIRTKKTAEQKWIELRDWLKSRMTYDTDVRLVLREMDRLDCT